MCDWVILLYQNVRKHCKSAIIIIIIKLKKKKPPKQKHKREKKNPDLSDTVPGQQLRCSEVGPALKYCWCISGRPGELRPHGLGRGSAGDTQQLE